MHCGIKSKREHTRDLGSQTMFVLHDFAHARPVRDLDRVTRPRTAESRERQTGGRSVTLSCDDDESREAARMTSQSC